MTRAILIGDIHVSAGYQFGKMDFNTGINSRLLDYEKTLETCINYTIDNNIELCIMMGDIFETRHPKPKEIAAFFKQIKRLSENKITTYIVQGNHEKIKYKFVGTALEPLRQLALPYIHVFIDTTAMPFIDKNGDVLNVILAPYKNREDYDKHLNENAVKEYQKDIYKEKDKLNLNIPTILCGHMMIDGTLPADVGDMMLNELIIPQETFKGIDITFMGHIHRSSILCKEPFIVYTGSIECKDFSERDHQKVFLVYDSSKPKHEAVEFIPLNVRKFHDFDFSFTSNETVDEIYSYIQKECAKSPLKDSIIRMKIKLDESKVEEISTLYIKKNILEQFNIFLVHAIDIIPILSKQTRLKEIVEKTTNEDIFKAYLSSQKDFDEKILSAGLEIISSEKYTTQ